MKLFLDDIRDPSGFYWVVARSYKDAVEKVKEYGFPTFVSFDHDLGEGKTGYDFAKYLVELDMDTNTMPQNFDFLVHSANPVGAKNICAYLRNYLEFKNRKN